MNNAFGFNKPTTAWNVVPQTKSEQCESTPIRIFKYNETTIVCNHSGQVTKISDKTQALKLPANIIAADLQGDILAVGTTQGLITINLAQTEVKMLTSYRNIVPYVKIHKDHIFASFLEIINNQVQYIQPINNKTNDQVINFNVLMIDKYQGDVKFEAPGNANNGLFDISNDILTIPQLTNFKEQQFIKYKIIDDNLQEMQNNLKISWPITAMSCFIADKLIGFENGILYFLSTNQKIMFDQRINCVQYVSNKNYYIVGLQNGAIVYINENLFAIQVFQCKQQNYEISCLCGDEVGKPVIIGVGSIQNLQQNGCLIFSQIVEVNNQVDIPNVV